MSIQSSVIADINNKHAEKLKQKYKSSMIEQLEAVGLEWDNNFLNPKDFSPNFEFGCENEERWFDIYLGMYLGIEEIQKIFSE